MFEKLVIKSRFVKHGIPFLILIVGGSFAFKNFTTLRYDFAKNEQIPPAERDEIEKIFKKPSEYNIDTEYEKYKQVDIDNWENRRIPRPWEEEEQASS